MAELVTAGNWTDYELIMTGDKQKLERWGNIILLRPDPQAIWPVSDKWGETHGVYHRSNTGGGHWEFKKKLPDRWTIRYKDLRFYVEPTGFKHTGLFPEQAVNWDYMIDKISSAGRKINVLNLFAYTGGATAACAYAGASVCHVDAAKGMVTHAKENLELSNLSSRPVRYIVDDAIKFVNREKRRSSKYDAIIMDPPAYGRGPSGELWKIEDKLYELVSICTELLSDNPLFFIINSYTGSVSPLLVENVLKMLLKDNKQSLKSYELGLKASKQDIVLPCGFTIRWESK